MARKVQSPPCRRCAETRRRIRQAVHKVLRLKGSSKAARMQKFRGQRD